MNLTAIVLNYNDFDNTSKCISNLLNCNLVNYIVCVDNCSTDDSFNKLCTLFVNSDRVALIKTNKNGGYGYGNNFGIKYAFVHLKSKYVLICNPDVIINNNCINYILAAFDDSNIAVVTAMQHINGKPIANYAWDVPKSVLYILQGTIFNKFVTNIFYKSPNNKEKFIISDCVAGACFVIDLTKISNIELYDENIFLYCEETVLGFKLKYDGLVSKTILNCHYDHLHSASINKSFKSKKKRQRLLYDSRLYVLKNYYKLSRFQLFLCKLLLRK